MAQPITITSGVEIGGGIEIGNHSIYDYQQTTTIQNVAGADGATGFFFQGTWPRTPTPSWYDIEPGWYVTGDPTLVVVSTDPVLQTVTVSGGNLISGAFYAFTPTLPTPGPT